MKFEGRDIPFQDHDESLRHLGYWVAVDGSDKEQWKKLNERCDEVAMALKGAAKTPAAMVKYIWQSVLTPRIVYPLTVVNARGPPDEHYRRDGALGASMVTATDSLAQIVPEGVAGGGCSTRRAGL